MIPVFVALVSPVREVERLVNEDAVVFVVDVPPLERGELAGPEVEDPGERARLENPEAGLLRLDRVLEHSSSRQPRPSRPSSSEASLR